MQDGEQFAQGHAGDQSFPIGDDRSMPKVPRPVAPNEVQPHLLL
jgi:hypothetical protein